MSLKVGWVRPARSWGVHTAAVGPVTNYVVFGPLAEGQMIEEIRFDWWGVAGTVITVEPALCGTGQGNAAAVAAGASLVEGFTSFLGGGGNTVIVGNLLVEMVGTNVLYVGRRIMEGARYVVMSVAFTGIGRLFASVKMVEEVVMEEPVVVAV